MTGRGEGHGAEEAATEGPSAAVWGGHHVDQGTTAGEGRAGQAGERGQQRVLGMGSEVGLGAAFPDGGGAGLILAPAGLQVGREGSAEPGVQRGRRSEGAAAELARQRGGGRAGSSGEAGEEAGVDSECRQLLG